MAEKLLMLALSPTMETGVIAKWLKNEGDSIESGDVLCEVETDKAVMDYESPTSGVLLKIVKPEGSSASIGDLIAIAGKAGEDISSLLGEVGGAAGAAAQPAQAAQPGTQTQAAQPAAQTQAAQAAQPSAQAPAARSGLSEAGGEAGGQAQPAEQAQPETVVEPAAGEAAAGPSGFIRSTPLARKLAEMNGIQLDAIPGSGPSGRIIKADVEQAMTAQPATAQQPAAPGAPAVGQAVTGTAQAASAQAIQGAAPAATAQGTAMPGDVAVPVSGKRRIIAQRLAESKFSAPHYYLKVRVEMDAFMAMRSQFNETGDVKISINAILIKLVAEVLKRHPIVNSSWAGDTIIRHGRVDVGLAVAQEDGLITPVVRDCVNKGLVQIETELKDLIQRARDNALKPDEYTGATFTISSLGSFGIEEFTAIINPPGSAILAVGEIRKEQVVQPDDSLQIRSLMRLTLSCDHRVIDGAVGAAFLSDLRKTLEQPIRAIY